MEDGTGGGEKMNGVSEWRGWDGGGRRSGGAMVGQRVVVIRGVVVVRER